MSDLKSALGASFIIVSPCNRCLDVTSPTNRQRDIPTHTIRPPNILSSVKIFYCDTLTMWHFSTVTFRLCDNFLLRHFDHVTFFYCDIPTLWQFPTVTLRPCDIFLLWRNRLTIFYCDIPSQSGRIVRPPQKVDAVKVNNFLIFTLWHSDPL